MRAFSSKCRQRQRRKQRIDAEFKHTPDRNHENDICDRLHHKEIRLHEDDFDRRLEHRVGRIRENMIGITVSACRQGSVCCREKHVNGIPRDLIGKVFSEGTARKEFTDLREEITPALYDAFLPHILQETFAVMYDVDFPVSARKKLRCSGSDCRTAVQPVKQRIDIRNDRVCVLHDLFHHNDLHQKNEDILPFGSPLKIGRFPEEIHQKQERCDHNRDLVAAVGYADERAGMIAVQDRVRADRAELKRLIQNVVGLLDILRDLIIHIMHIVFEDIGSPGDQREEDIEQSRDNYENVDMAPYFRKAFHRGNHCFCHTHPPSEKQAPERRCGDDDPSCGDRSHARDLADGTVILK